MPELKNIPVSKLRLDLDNHRTVHQKSEKDSIGVMIAISSDWFWALMENIIDDGYYPTDNIIVLKENKSFVVKEGNRRVASLKIIYGQIKGIDIPDNIKAKIATLGADWLDKNNEIPCAVYNKNEINTVKKVISLIHAKGEKAGRENWTAVARYGRDEKGKKELGLDLLEKYILNSKNLSSNQKECWGGDYPITVRQDNQNNPSTTTKAAKGQPDNNTGSVQSNPSKPKTKNVAYSITDAKSVYKKLEDFKPLGKNREKVVLLLDEMKKLKIDIYPHSFCFLLRSLFEISAKAYCKDNAKAGLSATKSDGNDKNLSDVLREIVTFMTSNMQDREKVKLLHGALTELNKKDGILSVTSFNQLIHNPKFSIQPNDICILFHNIFPLLEEMNN